MLPTSPSRRRRTNLRPYVVLLIVFCGLVSMMYFGVISRGPPPPQPKEAENRFGELLQDDGPPLMIDDKAATQHRQKKLCFSVDGYSGCGFFRRASCVAEQLQDSLGAIVNIQGGTREEYHQRLPELKRTIQDGSGWESHSTSPFVRRGCSGEPRLYIGGATEFSAYVRSEFPQVDLSKC